MDRCSVCSFPFILETSIWIVFCLKWRGDWPSIPMRWKSDSPVFTEHSAQCTQKPVSWYWVLIKAFCRVSQQGEKRQGSILSPQSGVASHFHELGEEGWCTEALAGRFWLEGFETWPFVVRCAKGASALGLPGQWTLHLWKGSHVQVLVMS